MNKQKLDKWGNGQGFRIDKKTIRKLHMKIGDPVEYEIINNKLIIVPTKQKDLLTEEYLVSHLRKDSFDDLVTDLLPEEYEV